MFIIHMEQVIPLTNKTVWDKFLGDIHDFKSTKHKKIDFDEVVILDTTDVWKIKEPYDNGWYEGVLRLTLFTNVASYTN